MKRILHKNMEKSTKTNPVSWTQELEMDWRAGKLIQARDILLKESRYISPIVHIPITKFHDALSLIQVAIDGIEKEAHNQAIADAIYTNDDEEEPVGLYDDIQEAYPDMENRR